MYLVFIVLMLALLGGLLGVVFWFFKSSGMFHPGPPDTKKWYEYLWAEL